MGFAICTVFLQDLFNFLCAVKKSQSNYTHRMSVLALLYIITENKQSILQYQVLRLHILHKAAPNHVVFASTHPVSRQGQDLKWLSGDTTHNNIINVKVTLFSPCPKLTQFNEICYHLCLCRYIMRKASGCKWLTIVSVYPSGTQA